jgi:hypothetical protein
MKKSIIVVLFVFILFTPSILAENLKTIKGTVTLPDNLVATENVEVSFMVEDQYSGSGSSIGITILKGTKSAQYEIQVDESLTAINLYYQINYFKAAISGQSVYLNKNGTTSTTATPFNMSENTLTVNFTLLKGKTLKVNLKRGSEIYSSDDLAFYLSMNNVDEPFRNYYIGPIIILKVQKLEYEISVVASDTPVNYTMYINSMSKNNVYVNRTAYYSTTGHFEGEYATTFALSSSTNTSFDFLLAKNQLLTGKLKLAKNAVVPSGYYTKISLTLQPVQGGNSIGKDIYVEENKNDIDYSIGIPQDRKNEEFRLLCNVYYPDYMRNAPINPLPGSSSGGGSSGGSGGRYWENLVENNKIRYYPKGQLYSEMCYSQSGLISDWYNGETFTFSTSNVSNVNFTLATDDDYYVGGYVCSYLTVPNEGLDIEVQLEDSLTGETISKNTVKIEKNNKYAPYKLLSNRAGNFLISMKILNQGIGYNNSKAYYSGNSVFTVNYNRSAAKTVVIDDFKSHSFGYDMYYENICLALGMLNVIDSNSEYSVFPYGSTEIILYSRDGMQLSTSSIYRSSSIRVYLSEFIIGVKIGNSKLYYSETNGVVNDFSNASRIKLYKYSELKQVYFPLVTGYSKGINNNLTVLTSYLSNNGNAFINKIGLANNISFIIENTGASLYNKKLYCIQSRNGNIIDIKGFNVDIISGKNINTKEVNFNMESSDEIKILFWDDNLIPLFNKIKY